MSDLRQNLEKDIHICDDSNEWKCIQNHSINIIVTNNRNTYKQIEDDNRIRFLSINKFLQYCSPFGFLTFWFDEISWSLRRAISATRINWRPFKTCVILVAIIIFATLSFISGFPVYECNQKIASWNPKDARKVQGACEKVIKFPFPLFSIFPSLKLDALINVGRATLITWNPDWKDTEKDLETKREILEAKREIVKTTKDYFKRAYNINSQNPQAAFHIDFINDFERVVLGSGNCSTAIVRYNSDPGTEPPVDVNSERDGTIDLYLNDRYKIKSSDFSILTELAHFLINRKSPVDETTSIQKATDLFDLFEQSSTKPLHYYNLLMSKAILQATSGFSEDAKQSFEKARKNARNSGLESYKIKFYLGNAHVQLASSDSNREDDAKEKIDYYKKALNYYDEVIQNNIAENFYQAWRNRGFVSYIVGLLYEKQNQMELAIPFYDKALSSFNRVFNGGSDSGKQPSFNVSIIDPDNEKNILNIKTNLELCAIQANCYNNSEKKMSLIENQIKGVITNYSYYIIHEGTDDPLFLIEHDHFYGCHNRQSKVKS